MRPSNPTVEVARGRRATAPSRHRSPQARRLLRRCSVPPEPRCRGCRAIPSARSRRTSRSRVASGSGTVRVSGCTRSREVPHPLPAETAGHRHLAASLHELEHPHDVLAVRPSGRSPRSDARVRDLARGQRTGLVESAEDVAPALVVRLNPSADPLLPTVELRCRRAVPHLGAVQGEILGRSVVATQFDEPPILDRTCEVAPVVAPAEPRQAPGVDAARADGRPTVPPSRRLNDPVRAWPACAAPTAGGSSAGTRSRRRRTRRRAGG